MLVSTFSSHYELIVIAGCSPEDCHSWGHRHAARRTDPHFKDTGRRSC